jgi:eukaryotic-like serine/threonine-protein kinase
MSDARQPRQIGRYQVVDVLGAGSMGVVYKAHDPAIGRDVAIKVVRIDAGSATEHDSSVERLRVEARAAGRCNHPAIISIFDFLEIDGDPAIVMEFVDGRSLYGHLRDRAVRNALEPVRLIRQVLEALGYAHGQGVIHRDIKPANILMTTGGTIKIADFGIARLPGLNATLTGATLGTPNYMAPEQLSGAAIDHRADLFAVGAIFYELLAGRPPFAGPNTAATLALLAGPAEADLTPVHASYRTILGHALAKDRTQRYRSAEEFAAALADPALSHPPVADQQTLLMSATAPATHWDPTLLRLAERELARFLGPMARVQVARASQAAGAPEDLFGTLAGLLPDQADRSRFLRAVGAGRGGPNQSAAGSIGGTASRGSGSVGSVRSTGPGSATGAPSLGSAGRPGGTASQSFAGIADAAAAAAQAALVQYVGPIARVLVREDAAQAVSARDFIERLCAHVTKPDQQAALRRRLAAEVEPKLG